MQNKPCNICPKCGGKSEVTDVRYRTGVPRRVRRCLSCGRKWSTVEVYEWECRPELMTMIEYQRAAMRTSRKDISPDDHLMNAMLGLAGETGECCDLVKKCFFQDGRDIREKLLDELSDVMWYVAEAATAMGWNLDDIARHNVEKLRRRYPDGFDAEKSLNRGNEQ